MLGAADELGGRSFIQLSIYREPTMDQALPWVLGTQRNNTKPSLSGLTEHTF